MSLDLSTVATFSFQSISTAGAAFRNLTPADQSPATAVGLAFQLSETRAYRLSRGILATAADLAAYETEGGALVNWALAAGGQERQLVTRAIRNDAGRTGEIFLVHQMSGMTRTNARTFMADYFAAGGDLKAIAEWLAASGSVLRRHQVKSADTVGFIGDAIDWVADQFEDVVDIIAEGATAVVDAVINTGRSLAEFVGGVVNWSIEKVGDLVRGLLEGGQSVFDILKAAVDHSVASVTKFTQALIKAGKSIGAILEEGLKFAQNTLQVVVDGLLKAAQGVGDILSWAAGEIASVTRRVVQALRDLGHAALQIFRSVFSAAVAIVRDVLQALLAIGETVAGLIRTAVLQPQRLFAEFVAALARIGTTVADLFSAVVGHVADGVRKMARALVEAGKSVLQLAKWAVGKAASIIKDVVRGILEAGKLVVDILTDIAAQSIAFITEVLRAVMDIVRVVIDLIEDILTLAIDLVRKFFKALTRLAGALAKFAAEVFRMTYKLAAALVSKMIDAGLAVAEIMETVVGANYWVFRRMVNGIIAKTGRFGAVLDWLLTRAESTVSEAWEDVLQAARYAGGEIKDAIAWAVDKSDAALDAVLNAWETMGERLLDFYEEAARLAQSGVTGLFERIGAATRRLENSVLYVLKYLEKDFLPGIRDFIKGALDAGYELAELVVDLASLTAQAALRGFEVLLELGYTLTELLIATMQHPDQLLANFLTAAEAAGNSLAEIWDTVFKETGGQYAEAVTQTWRDLGKPVKEMLNAALEVGLGGVDTIVSYLLSQLASYRPMTAAEITTARLVYGDTFDYSRIYFSQESLSNDIIFGLQDWANDTENSRAFVTNNLVNFDVNDGPLDNPTMIHELGHVWQFQATGPFYMAEAIHAQSTPEAYDYGYTDEANGNGAESTLQQLLADNPGATDRELFETFNREQQAQLLMHYYVRRYEEKPALDFSLWERYQQVVFS